jgi:NAD(P)-dependent dehydrogenase (short-subunit alcohol dehydrogenase family)
MRHSFISEAIISNFSQENKVAIITGAGGGIGFETARALAYLGAKVVIAEINKVNGKAAAEKINTELGTEIAWFIHTDIGDQQSVNRLSRQVLRKYGQVDIIINNATVSPMGAVKDGQIEDWDISYRVNLRGPVLLAKAFLPGMLERDHGILICVSSAGGKYMGAYEIMKSAQVELSQTLDAELEETNVHSFTITPGIVPDTPGAREGITAVSSMYGMTIDDFVEMSKDQRISAEAAGTGFAAAAVLAGQFRGLEIGVITALNAAGIELDTENKNGNRGVSFDDASYPKVIELCYLIIETFEARLDEWNRMPLFQKQWMKRDFKNFSGISLEQMESALRTLQKALVEQQQIQLSKQDLPINRLSAYYQHYLDLVKGYIKEQQLLGEQVTLIESWINQIEDLNDLLF